MSMLNTTLLLLALGVAIALADADYEPEYQHTTTTTEEPKSKALNTVLFPHYFSARKPCPAAREVGYCHPDDDNGFNALLG